MFAAVFPLFMQLILASNSPRRREYMKKITEDFRVIPSDVEETVPPDLPPQRVAETLAAMKAKDVYDKHGGVVLGADTIVCLGAEILGKPKDEADAKRMLRALSGGVHRVITGVALCFDGGCHIESVVTEVKVGKMDEALIEKYIQTGSPMDKAGAYGIQDGYVPVVEIRGSYDNVVGFPTERIAAILKEVFANDDQSLRR